MGAILLFIVGLLCLLATIGFILKYATGRWFDEDFVSDFVGKSMGTVGKITVAAIAFIFVYVIYSLITNG